MSGVVKAVGKVFKKVVKVVKKVVKAVVKIVKPILVAAAVYFTAGLAIGAFGGASFVAGLPGWGAGSMFSSAAGALGGWTGFAPGGALLGAAETATGIAGGLAGAGEAAGGALATGTEQAAMLAEQTAGFGAEGAAMTNAAAGGTIVSAPGPTGIVGKVWEGAKSLGSKAYDFATSKGGGVALGYGLKGYAEAKAQEEELDWKLARQKEQGVGGVDQYGNKVELPKSVIQRPQLSTQATTLPDGTQSIAAAPAEAAQAAPAAQAAGAPTAPGAVNMAGIIGQTRAQLAPGYQGLPNYNAGMTVDELIAAQRNGEVMMPVA